MVKALRPASRRGSARVSSSAARSLRRSR